jgi:hypothetical protein
MEIKDGLVTARERAPSRFKRIKNMAIPLALVAALSVSSVPAFAARGSGSGSGGSGGRPTRPAPTQPTNPNPPTGGVVTLPSGGTGVFHPGRPLGDHASGGCNEIITDLVVFGGGIDARILTDFLHIAGGQTTRLATSGTQEAMTTPFTRWEGRLGMPASRSQIYGGGRIGLEMFCAGGASGTNGALDILDFQNRVNSQSSEIDGLAFGTMPLKSG